MQLYRFQIAGVGRDAVYKWFFGFRNYCRFHLVCPGQKIGERYFSWAWYKLKSICVLYFHFVPSTEKVSLAKFFPERGGGQTKWNRQYKSVNLRRCAHVVVFTTSRTHEIPQKPIAICGSSEEPRRWVPLRRMRLRTRPSHSIAARSF